MLIFASLFLTFMSTVLCAPYAPHLVLLNDSSIENDLIPPPSNTTLGNGNGKRPPDPFAIREPRFLTRFSKYTGPKITVEEVKSLQTKFNTLLDGFTKMGLTDKDPIPGGYIEITADGGSVKFELLPISKAFALTVDGANEIADAVELYMRQWDAKEGPLLCDVEYREKTPTGWNTIAVGSLARAISIS